MHGLNRELTVCAPVGKGNRFSNIREKPLRERAGAAKCFNFNLLSGDCPSIDCIPLAASSSSGEKDRQGVGSRRACGEGQGAAGSGCGQRLQGCQGSLCAGSAGLAVGNGMFPLALQEQKQLWKSLKRRLQNEKKN